MTVLQSATDRSITARDLCARLGVAAPESIADTVLTGVAPLETAGPSEVAYVQAKKFAAALATCRAGLILVPADAGLSHPNSVALPHVMPVVIQVLNHFHPRPVASGRIHPAAVVDPTAVIGANVDIGPNATIEAGVRIGAGTRIDAGAFVGEGSTLGEKCWLHANVSVLHGSRLGNRVEIHSSTVIGADGFRYELTRAGLTKVPQVGIVVIEDDVEIGAGTTIDRAGLAETRIGARTKIDNLVQIGHNCIIGSDCVIVSQVGIAGSVKMGRGVMIGGGSTIKDHVTIGNGVKIAGFSAVQHDLADGAEVIGFLAIPLRDYTKFAWFYKNFSGQWDRIRRVLKEAEKGQEGNS